MAAASAPTTAPTTAPASAAPALTAKESFAAAVKIIEDGSTNAEPESAPRDLETRPATEIKTESEAPATTSEPLSKSWAAIAKAEAKNREDTKRIKAERETAATEIKQAKELLDRAKADPISLAIEIAEKHGGKEWFDLVARRVLNDGKPTESEAVRKVHTETEELRAKIAEMEKKEQDHASQQQLQAYEAQVDAILAKDEYELLRTYPGSKREIFQYIQGVIEQTGEVLQPFDAVARIDAGLREHLSTLKGSKAWQALFAQAVEAAEPTPQKTGPKPAAKTLTTQLAAQTSGSDDEDRPRSKAELIREAARLIKFDP